MPYLPPHLRPGYVPPELRPGYVAPVVKTGARFITNVNDRAETNVAPNTGVRYEPRRNAVPAKKTLKATRKISPNAKAPKSPSHNVDDWAPKFRNYVKKELAERSKHTTLKRTRKAKKHTRRMKPKRHQSKKGKHTRGKR